MSSKRPAPKGKTQPLKRRCGLPPVRQLVLPSACGTSTAPAAASESTSSETTAPGIIKIKVATPKESKIIDTQETAKIKDLKAAVSIAFKDEEKDKEIPVSKICLVYSGKILGDNDALNSLGGKTVHLVIRKRVLKAAAGQVIIVVVNLHNLSVSDHLHVYLSDLDRAFVDISIQVAFYKSTKAPY